MTDARTQSPAASASDWGSTPLHRAVRWLFAVLVVLLPLQFLVAFATHPEPYPALLLPGFGEVPDRGGNVDVVRAEVVASFVDGSVVRLRPDQLLDDLPGLGAINLLHAVFPPQPGGRAEHPTAQAGDPRTRAWLLHRLAALAPGRAPVNVSVEWTTWRYHGADTATARLVDREESVAVRF